jgi:hypothetical protein
MVSSHLGNFTQQTVTERTLHSARWVDGAFSFVALSGVATGLVHRRVVERRGLRASAEKLVRRAGWLMLVHVALCVVIVSVANWYPWAHVPLTPSWRLGGGIWPTFGRIADLRLEPDHNAVLPMYVVLLLWAVVAVALLRRHRVRTVLTISGAVYAFSQTVDGGALSAGTFQIAGWQLLFTAGLVVGWEWEHGVATLTARRRAWIGAAAAAVAGTMFAAAHVAPDRMTAWFGSTLDKFNGGGLAFVDAAALLVVGYTLIEWARGVPWIATALRPAAVLGWRGLPGYVTMVLGILLLDLLPGVPRNDLVVWLLIASCGVAEFVATRSARRHRARRPVISPALDLVPQPAAVA